jgi:hypothetical protein
VALVQAGTGKIEEELKALSAAYQEKSQVVQAGKRKKGGSLMTAPLEEVLTEEHVKVRAGGRLVCVLVWCGIGLCDGEGGKGRGERELRWL